MVEMEARKDFMPGYFVQLWLFFHLPEKWKIRQVTFFYTEMKAEIQRSGERYICSSDVDISWTVEVQGCGREKKHIQRCWMWAHNKREPHVHIYSFCHNNSQSWRAKTLCSLGSCKDRPRQCTMWFSFCACVLLFVKCALALSSYLF